MTRLCRVFHSEIISFWTHTFSLLARRTSCCSVFVIASLLSLTLSANPVQAAVGDLDTTFNSTGVVTTTIGAYNNAAQGVVIQSNGMIVVGGSLSGSASSNVDFGALRYSTTGALDTSGFNSPNGWVRTVIYSGNDDSPNAVVLQPDGKILTAGYVINASGYERFVLTRYTTAGVLDTDSTTGLTTNGYVITAVTSGHCSASALTLLPDNKILAAGYAYTTRNDFALARYSMTGALDQTKTQAVGNDGSEIKAVGVQSDGKIVVAGYAYNAVSDHGV